jgi:hypothetical protein
MTSLTCTIPALPTLGNVTDWAAGTAETETFELTTTTGSVPYAQFSRFTLWPSFRADPHCLCSVYQAEEGSPIRSLEG